MEMMNGDGSKEVLEAQAHVWKYTFNYVTSMTLKSAIQLGIPDAIAAHHKPITLSELVKALSIPPSKSPDDLFRLMRILVHSGFFAMERVDQEERFSLTPSSKLLLKNHEASLSDFVVMMIDPVFVSPCNYLADSFQGTDSPSAFMLAHGMEMWDYCAQNLEANTRFNAAMVSDAGFVMRVVLKHWKAMFEGFGSLVDVGGGTGTVARAISDAFPLMKLTVFDLPHVVSNMSDSETLEFVAGDMFKSIPSADIVLLKWILHDWGDKECVKILRGCKKAISESKEGKVMIIDIVLDENKGTHESVETQLCFDIFMMALVTGKERTEAQWERIFLDAGFSSYKITHGLCLNRSIIEVFP